MKERHEKDDAALPVFSIPDEMAEAIGHLIYHCARIEVELHAAIFDLLPIGHKEGRYLVRAARLDEYVTIIGNVLAHRQIKPPFNLSRLRKLCAKLKELRDQLAHGVWTFSRKYGPRLRITTGNWAADELAYSPATLHKIFNPEGRDVPLEFLQARDRLAKHVIFWAMFLRMSVKVKSGPPPSLKKLRASVAKAQVSRLTPLRPTRRR